jgi:hypothetical protein
MILNKTYDELKAMRRVLEKDEFTRAPIGTSVVILLVDQLISAMDEMADLEQKVAFLESAREDATGQITELNYRLSES